MENNLFCTTANSATFFGIYQKQMKVQTAKTKTS